LKKLENRVDFEYCGVLQQHFRDFVKMKRAIGYKYNAEAALLKIFDKFTLDFHLPKNSLPKNVVSEWSVKRPHESDKTHKSRVHVVNMLARFMAKNGHDAYIHPILPGKKLGGFKYKPHIYSDNELFQFFKATDDMKETGRSPYRHIIIPLLFRILLCCGMRLSEALKLRIDDVDVTNGVLRIRQTKFSKDRYVPITDELLGLCIDYLDATKNAYREERFFFPTPKGVRYDVSTIENIFRGLLFSANISHGGRGVGPRIHDFRHTFSVRCLKKWVLEGKEISSALPVLSTYLGHADLRGSEFYLRLTSDLYPNIIQTFDNAFGDVIPTGGADIENN
jgi:integrase